MPSLVRAVGGGAAIGAIFINHTTHDAGDDGVRWVTGEITDDNSR